jgi:hypothetical protein
VSQLFEELRLLGDPFAIDALYYVARDEPQLGESLLQELRLVGDAELKASPGAR